MKLTKFLVAAPALLALVAAFGCGGEKLPAGMPKPVSTTLTFTIDGKGLADANITMTPADDGTYVAIGKTDSNGVAEMKTDGKYNGAVPGEYKITVSAKDEIDYGEYGPPPTGDSAALEEWNRKVEGVTFPRVSVVPQEFTAVDVTPLTITVGEGKAAETFDLGGSVREEVEVEEK
ncbi:MAG: hypothetical protein IKU86_00370 [Thermoguttaceae bacterium]|nr:hypothetical protein [Thermoguttaceae bacterium]